MGRRRIATSLHSLGRSYLHHVSGSLPKARANGICASFPNYYFAIVSSRHYTQLALDDGRSSKFCLGIEWRSNFAASMRPPPHRLEISTMAASLDQFDSQRIARSNSTIISTSGRTRASCYEQRCGHTSGQNFEGKEKISVTFVDKDGDETKIQVPVGMSMLEAAHENDIELEGACEGSLACSTCHVIVMEEDMYTRLPEPSDEENDMLDLAFGLTETSRLGCQVIAKPELDGLHLALPAATRNFAVDGHVPKPH